MPSNDPLAIPAMLSKALEGAGHLHFYTSLLSAFGRLLPEADLYVLRYNSYTRPELLYYHGQRQAAVDIYIESLYKIDPIFQICATDSQSGVVLLRDFEGASQEFQNYYSFISGVGISENLTVMYPVVGGTTIALAWSFLQQGFIVSEPLLSQLRALFQLTQPFHHIHLQALLSHRGQGLLDQAATAPWIALSSSLETMCASDNCTDSDLADVKRLLAQKAVVTGEVIIDGSPWYAERMTPNNAVAPFGWFLQKRLQPHFTGPRSFDEALERLYKGGMTPREQDVVKLSLQGLENQAIASRLGLSHQVIKNYKGSIYLKLDVTSERELFRRFLGIILEEGEHEL